MTAWARPPLLLAIAGVVLAGAATAFVVRGGQGAPAPDVRATAALRAAATVAERNATLGRNALPARGPYLYLRTENLVMALREVDGMFYSAQVLTSREQWTASDGSRRIRERAGEAVFLGERDRQRWEADGRPEMVSEINSDSGPGALGDLDPSLQPTDPTALGRRLRADAELGQISVNVSMFEAVRSLLGESFGLPELRAALYRVTAEIPGIEYLGTVIDPLGRPGIGVALTWEQQGVRLRETLIFDPETAAPLAHERILLDPAGWVDVKTPARIGYRAYAETVYVDALPEPVSGSATPIGEARR